MWPSVELREIRVFLTLAEELHFGRTAERLRLTPSRVSQTIRTLESRVGGQLFVRTSRRVSLTPLGEQLLRRMRPAYEQMERAVAETREAAVGVAGVVRVGTYTPVNYGPHFLEIIETFQTRYPECHVLCIDTGFGKDQFDWLRQHEVEVLAMRLPVSTPDVTVGPILSRESRIVIVARGDPLATRRSVTLDDLTDYRIPYTSRFLPHEMIEAFVPARTGTGAFLRREEQSPAFFPNAMVRVATGEFAYLTVPSVLDHYHHPDVVGVPVRDLPASETALVSLTTESVAKTHAFVEVATEVLETYGLGPRPSSAPHTRRGQGAGRARRRRRPDRPNG